jgi:hypothetical protein
MIARQEREGVMRFRSIALITLWTLLSGPAIRPPEAGTLLSGGAVAVAPAKRTTESRPPMTQDNSLSKKVVKGDGPSRPSP